MAGQQEICQTAVWLSDIAVEVPWIAGCGLDVNVGDVCNPTYKSVCCHGKCETGLLFKGVGKQVSYLDMRSRQLALCTNNCGQAHDAKRVACAACGTRWGWVRVEEVCVVESHCAVFFFYFSTLTGSVSSWWFYFTGRPLLQDCFTNYF